MTAPNRNTLWARILVEEFAASGIESVCLAPGSRSTPLTVAFARHEQIQTFSHLDERSAAFFAVGRGRKTGRPSPVVCTSGTAAANFHPAVLEATESRVPMVVLTADRPPELQDSGANQTTDQEKLYGDAVRWYQTLPEPEPDPRKLRSLRVTACRAVARATGTPPGPVHLNVPFRKPLEPVVVEDDIPDSFDQQAPLAVDGREQAFVQTSHGRAFPDEETIRQISTQIDATDRGLIVCGPADSPVPRRDTLVELVDVTGFPVLADPLSGHRFGPHSGSLPVCGGYDSYLDDATTLPDPEIVLRFGASPTSKTLRTYLAAVDATQVVVDQAGGWPEAEFTASHLVAADPDELATALTASVSTRGSDQYRTLFERAETRYWALVDSWSGSETDENGFTDSIFEGDILRTVAARCPPATTLVVSNSMPVRDLDRFGQPRTDPLDVIGNRGVSGIDGVISTALGAGTAATGPLVLVIGDVAFYHDMNGLLALKRCGVDATIVLIDNDGGGIFHKLPIESFDPPFTEQFRTPHGLDFAPTGELYGFDFETYSEHEPFTQAFEAAVQSAGTQVLAVDTDPERSQRRREQLHEEVTQSILSD